MENTSWGSLPFEIVEKILLDVPTYHLSFNKPWVCKLWTEVLFQPKFWIRKLMKINIKINNAILSVLTEFERNIQVACLYQACLYEEHASLETPMDDITSMLISTVGFDNMNVSDDINEMLMASALLVSKPPSSDQWVELLLQKEKHTILPLLLKLLAVRPYNKLTVNIFDDYGFDNFSPRYDYFKMLKGPNELANINRLRGCVSTIEGLSEDVNDLILSIAVDGNNIAIDPGILITKDIIKMLHLKAGTDVSRLKVHPTGCCWSFMVSGLEPTHIAWMTNAAKVLCPEPYSLILLSCRLNKSSSERLLQSMAEANVNPLRVICVSSTLNEDDAKQMTRLATELWTEVDEDDDWFQWYESNEKLSENNTFIQIMWDEEF